MSHPFYRRIADLRPTLGLVIPTWFPADFDVAEAARILGTTTADLDAVFEPGNVRLVADGSPVAAAAFARLGLGGIALDHLTDGPHGKGGAVARGFARLLENPQLEWFLVRDHDGDHFLHDAPRLVRLGLQMAAATELPTVLVNGGRDDPGRPMGWERGEYERLVNQVIWNGLRYHAARGGRALDERWLRPAALIPDLQSGYKCYSRAAAARLVDATAEADWAMRRWGCEVLATVEVAVDGVYGEVPRSALDEQPMTTYEGGASRVRIHGDIVLWTAHRLELPGDAVLSWFDAALAHGQLRSLAAAVEPLRELRDYLAEHLGVTAQGAAWPWFG